MICPILSSKVFTFQHELSKRLPAQSQQLEQSLKCVHVNNKDTRTTVEYR